MSRLFLPLPWMYGRRRLTRIEIAVYAAVVGALAVLFFSYLTDYMEMAEKTAMETTLKNVTAAINLRYATLVLTGEGARTAQWPGENPFAIARAFPPNYRGEIGAQPAGNAERPGWVFDVSRGELIYLPRLFRHLDAGQLDQLRFRLERHPSGTGYVLVPTTLYSWDVTASAVNSQSPCRHARTSLFS